MSDEVMRALGEIQRDLGEMKGMLSIHVKAFDQHVIDDRGLGVRLQEIELHVAGHKGAARLAALVATVAGSAAGLLSALAHAHWWGGK